jgi:RimJ/RimL family protein N-acetyltransferase
MNEEQTATDIPVGDESPCRYVHYECTRATFRPSTAHRVRWLDWECDYDLASTIWPEESPLARETWQEAREMGYRYCGIAARCPAGGERLLAIAAVWRYSEMAWEVAAVRTQPDARRRGYSKAVVSFVTAHILDKDRRATCTTGADNTAMQRTAESVGFCRQ